MSPESPGAQPCMKASVSPGHEPKRRGWLRRAGRCLCVTAIGCLLLLLTSWATAALYFDVRLSWLATTLAVRAGTAGIRAAWKGAEKRRLEELRREIAAEIAAIEAQRQK